MEATTEVIYKKIQNYTEDLKFLHQMFQKYPYLKTIHSVNDEDYYEDNDFQIDGLEVLINDHEIPAEYIVNADIMQSSDKDVTWEMIDQAMEETWDQSFPYDNEDAEDVEGYAYVILTLQSLKTMGMDANDLFKILDTVVNMSYDSPDTGGIVLFEPEHLNKFWFNMGNI